MPTHGCAEVGAVGSDHGEVLRPPQKRPFYKRQQHLQMEQSQLKEMYVFEQRSTTLFTKAGS
jgi:hypothetical protein